MNKRRIGILGGTFDPPHLGHLLIAEEVRMNLDLEEIWFIPSHTPPHKRVANTSTADRVLMLECAIKDNPYFKINTIEIERLGKSYTVDTMESLCTTNEDVEFYFIIGADMVEYLPHWQRINELLQLVNFVGVNRANYTLDTSYPVIEVNIPMFDISSSMIRNRLISRISVKYLIPDAVDYVIKERQLYEG
jgi:nicotinate-nucleotide adenylyltransferase